MIAGYPNNQCAEIRIVRPPSTAPLQADAVYGEEINVSGQCNNNLAEDTIHYLNRNYAVTYGAKSDLARLDWIRMSGITTQSLGRILHIDVTIRDNDGVLVDQVLANYRSDKGDSGAPVFKITGSSSAILLGQHVGKAKLVNFDGEQAPLYNVTRWGMTVFSPWDQVESTLWG